MLEFDPLDPFPYLPESRHDYAAEQAHAAQVDAWLGLATEETERALTASGAGDSASHQGYQSRQSHQRNWAGLPIQALMTPYSELRFILEELGLQPGETVVDLGAAYGRMAFVMARHYPQNSFVGYELEPTRVHEGQRCLRAFSALSAQLGRESAASATVPSGGSAEIYLAVADLNDESFRLPAADYYFIYDYGTREAIEKTLDDLREIARERAIVVVGRGRCVRDGIERRHPWLSQVVPPRHHGRFSIYLSRERGSLSSSPKTATSAEMSS